MESLPYENLVACLIIHQETPANLVDYLREHEFSIPSNIGTLCKNLNVKLHKQNREYFDNPNPAEPPSSWLADMGIYGLYHKMYGTPFEPEYRDQIAGFDGALRILEDPKMRRAVQAMALADIDDDDIELMLNARYDITYAPNDIKFFLEHYFNVDGLRTPERKELVDAESNPEFKNMYLIAMRGDKSYLLWKLGLAPTKTYSEMMQEMMNDAFYMFKEKSRTGRQSEEAYRWSQLALKIAEKLDKHEKEEDDANNLFKGLDFGLKTQEVPRILSMDELGEDAPDFELETQSPGDIPRKKDLEQ